MGHLLEVRDLSIAFRKLEKKSKDLPLTPGIDNVSITLQKGETLGLVGESGCGKTLSSLAVMGLLPDSAAVTGGRIGFDGEDLLELPERDRNKVRGARIGMIFQDPMTSLSPYYTVGNQIMEGMRYHLALSKKQARKRGLELLQKVGIPAPERVFDEYPSQLSGGMRQRVMIAIAISCEPDLLIADEPTTALDVTTQAQILELLHHLQKENGMAMILISHDLGVIAEMCQRVIVMYAGQVIEEGRTRELFHDPAHPYTQALLAATPRLDTKQERFYQIPGQVPPPSEWGAACRFLARCPKATHECQHAPSLLTLGGGRQARCWYAGDTSTGREEARRA
ncbi:ABC transporter ATP-binding protein [Tumebacillus sp. DT12]|uniref:ABC transporter ATP-binding protein n=1 Tax=Tumebacillus lacus TaxID=2995335 RepID=A0ABT3X552_9BACL|nr:ABC transporter ATP-binding protein [Tumebacillus lacus]MCX7572030.1 ABC transporter ATP-binding protein [Tumebacillus lacus]